MDETVSRELDKEGYRAAMARLHDIFKGISETVNKVTQWRCPYKTVEDRCTANFGCRNQERSVALGEPFPCVGSDDLDYRGAWEK
jgi:hypothetical protein